MVSLKFNTRPGCSDDKLAVARTIAKSLMGSAEPGDGIGGTEGATLGPQRHGPIGGEPSSQAQGVQTGVHQGGEHLTQSGAAQGMAVFVPATNPPAVEALVLLDEDGTQGSNLVESSAMVSWVPLRLPSQRGGR
jgi:hypothetical protein